jgi:hypothetical protein
MTGPLPQRALNAIIRLDFESFIRKCFQTLSPGQTFVPSWPTEALAYQLDRVRRGEIRRLIVNMPPRSLKSITASVAFPAFLLGHDPTRRIICASYSSELSRKLSNDFRAILDCAWYKGRFRAPSSAHSRILKAKSSSPNAAFDSRLPSGARLPEEGAT